jgi:hypothetical protein
VPKRRLIEGVTGRGGRKPLARCAPYGGALASDSFDEAFLKLEVLTKSGLWPLRASVRDDLEHHAGVDVVVRVATRWIVAKLRHRRFFSLGELNATIGDLVERLNNRVRRHLGTSRRAAMARHPGLVLACSSAPHRPQDYPEVGFASRSAQYPAGHVLGNRLGVEAR